MPFLRWLLRKRYIHTLVRVSWHNYVCILNRSCIVVIQLYLSLIMSNKLFWSWSWSCWTRMEKRKWRLVCQTCCCQNHQKNLHRNCLIVSLCWSMWNHPFRTLDRTHTLQRVLWRTSSIVWYVQQWKTWKKLLMEKQCLQQPLMTLKIILWPWKISL